MNIERCTDSQVWESFLESHAPERVFQSWSWGDFQKVLGNPVHRFLVRDSQTGDILLGAQIVEQTLGDRYVQWTVADGPVFARTCDPETIEEVLRVFTDAVRSSIPSSGVFLRIEPRDIRLGALRSLGFVQAFRSLRPSATVRIALPGNDGCDDLLKLFKQKTRYNVRLAEKKGVHITHSSLGRDVEPFLELLEETVERDGFSGHDPMHYRKLMQVLGKRGEARVFTATYENTVLASAIVVFYGTTATYLYGASSNEHRNVMAHVLLQWHVMCYASDFGSRWYDLLGVAPLETSEKSWTVSDEQDSWAGVTRFKLGFVNSGKAGEYIEYPGSFDLPVRRVPYRLMVMRRSLQRSSH